MRGDKKIWKKKLQEKLKIKEELKDFANKFLSGTEKDKFLETSEIAYLLEEGIPFLEKKVEFLSTGVYNSEYSQDENNKKAIECFQNAFEISHGALGKGPLQRTAAKALTLARSIIDEQVDKNKALKNLNEVRDILKVFLKIANEPILKLNLKNSFFLFKSMISTQLKILEEIKKNDEEYKEYKVLLRRKSKNRELRELIKINRDYAEILRKKDKEHSEKAREWIKSDYFTFITLLKMLWVYNEKFFPEKNSTLLHLFRNLQKYEEISAKIKLNDEEYEKLLERKNKGEYVDDLIKQNRYNAKLLAELEKKYKDKFLSI